MQSQLLVLHKITASCFLLYVYCPLNRFTTGSTAGPSRAIPSGPLLTEVFNIFWKIKLSLELSLCAFVAKVCLVCFTNMLLCVLYFASLHFMWLHSNYIIILGEWLCVFIGAVKKKKKIKLVL